MSRSLALSRGLRPFVTPFLERPRDTITDAVETVRDRRGISTGTPLVVVADPLHIGRTLHTILLEDA